RGEETPALAYRIEKGQTYVDSTRRWASKFIAGTNINGTTPVALMSNGAPSATYNFGLGAGTLAADAGVYNCWMPGLANGGAAGGITTNLGTITNYVYNSGTDRTTFTLTLPVAGSGAFITVLNPSLTSDYIRIIPVAYDSTANANDFHPD